MTKLFKHLLVVALLSYLPTRSMAWSLTGHRVVADIAQQHLHPRAKKAIEKIMGQDVLAATANWMDFIKSEPAYNRYGTWHYVNLPGGLTYDQVKTRLGQDTAENVYNRILFISKELKKPSLSLTDKRMYLSFLVHMVGDLHQPLHVGHLEDKGGNDIKVSWFGKSTNLHSLWDSALIDYQQYSFSEYSRILNRPSPIQVRQWQQDELSKWIYESYQMADGLYKEAQKNTNYGYRYNYDHIANLEKRLLQAGVRLAGLLNSIYSK